MISSGRGSIVRVLVLLGGLCPVMARGGQEPEAALKPLGATAFAPLPLGTIKPAGWLRDQLRIQADGLSGHLDEFWPDIKESAWFGGQAEGWERVPYWLDGMVPLAYTLDDPTLKDKVVRAVNFILEHQHQDGWLGPVGDSLKHKPYDVWPLFPLFKALVQYGEASGDPRIDQALLRCSRKIDEVITREPLYSWAKVRAADLVVPLYRLERSAPGSARSGSWPRRRLPRATTGAPSLSTSRSQPGPIRRKAWKTTV